MGKIRRLYTPTFALAFFIALEKHVIRQERLKKYEMRRLHYVENSRFQKRNNIPNRFFVPAPYPKEPEIMETFIDIKTGKECVLNPRMNKKWP